MTNQENNFAPTCISPEEVAAALIGIENELEQYKVLYNLSQKFVNVYENQGGFIVIGTPFERFFINELATQPFMVRNILDINPRYKPKKMQMVFSNSSNFWFVRAINQYDWILSQNYEQALRGEGNIEKVKYL